MNHLSPGRFRLVFIPSVLLALWGGLMFFSATQGAFANLIGMLFSMYAAYYAAIAAVKAYRTRGRIDKGETGIPPDGAGMFAVCAAVLSFTVFINMAYYGALIDMLPASVLTPIVIALLACATLWPWLGLLCAGKYRHLRTQSVWGFASLLAMPVLPIVGVGAFIAFISLSSGVKLVVLAVLCLLIWGARKFSGRMDGRARLRAGFVTIAIILACAAAFWWHRHPYELASEAAYRNKDYPGAIEILRPLAEAGSAKAAYKMAFYYGSQVNPKPDHAAALKWYKVAAEQGDRESAWQVARAYLAGDGAPKDKAAAAKWAQIAADEGEPGAQKLLGEFYHAGDAGLPQDMTKAIYWMERAAKQGLRSATEKAYWYHRLGGAGMKPDIGQAYFWYIVWRDSTMGQAFGYCPDTTPPPPEGAKGGSGGYPPASCEDEQLKPLLTVQQIAAAKSRFRFWFAVPEKPWKDMSF